MSYQPVDNWTRGASMLRALVRGVKRHPYAHGLVRLVWWGILEITVTEAEVQIVSRWLREHGGETGAMDLPVPEYTRRPWTRLYRWSRAAAETHERAGGKWAPEPPPRKGESDTFTPGSDPRRREGSR